MWKYHTANWRRQLVYDHCSRGATAVAVAEQRFWTLNLNLSSFHGQLSTAWRQRPAAYHRCRRRHRRSPSTAVGPLHSGGGAVEAGEERTFSNVAVSGGVVWYYKRLRKDEIKKKQIWQIRRGQTCGSDVAEIVFFLNCSPPRGDPSPFFESVKT